MMKHVVRAKRCRGGKRTLTVQGRSSFKRKDLDFFSAVKIYVCVCAPCLLFIAVHIFQLFGTAHKQFSRLIWTWKQNFQLMCPHPCRWIPSGKMKENIKTCFGAALTFSFCLSLALPVLFYISVFLVSLIQIQDFSSGFWDGTKLACWMKGETPWRFFPKLSIYLRATNTSQSFRITILPQVPDNRDKTCTVSFGIQTHIKGNFFWTFCSCTSSQSQTWMALWTAFVLGSLRQLMAWWLAPLWWKASMLCLTVLSRDWALHSAVVQVRIHTG